MQSEGEEIGLVLTSAMPMPSTISSFPKSTPSPVDALLTVKITEAIKNDDIDQIKTILNEVNIPIDIFRSPFGSILHLACLCGSLHLCAYFVHNYPTLNINTQNLNDGQTPLHIASKLGRQDVVELLLLSFDDIIDDTIHDRNGRTAYDLSENKGISSIFEYAKNLHVIKKTKEMHSYAHRGDIDSLRQLFENPRNQALLDINALDAAGETCLHTSARNGNVQLVQLCLNLGGDPFIKNKRGKIPLELARDECIKALLKEAPMVNTTDKSHRCEGFLSKWTNYAEGYRRRWFVLEDGIISYYKSQVDYPVNCKGSLNLQFASIVPHSTDKLRFEVMGLNSRMRYHLRADNAAEAKRWVIAIRQAQQDMSLNGSPTRKYTTGIPIAGSGSFADDKVDFLSFDDPFIKAGDELFKDIAECIASLESLLTIDPGKAIVNRLHEAFYGWRKREDEWKDRWQAEILQRQLFEDSLRTLALQNHKLEIWTRRNLRGDVSTIASSLFMGQDYVGTEEFFDAMQSDEEYYGEEEESEEIYIREADGNEESLGEFKELTIGEGREQDIKMARPEEQQLAVSMGYPIKPRTKLPADRGNMPPINLWSIVKGMLGKDLFRVPLPVNFSEPLSMLQRLSEEMEYSHLLDQAANSPDIIQRVALVAAFAISGYASTDNRLNKPFNPIFGETFEYVHCNWKYMAEQVSHHPPISAAHCDSPLWTYESEANVKNKFTGKSLDLIPEGFTCVTLKTTGECFHWTNAKTSIYNLIVGKLWLDHHGTMAIRIIGRDDIRCSVEFVPARWISSTTKQIKGRIIRCISEKNAGKSTEEEYKFSGAWNSHIRDEQGRELWRRHPNPPNHHHNNNLMYHMTQYAMNLNYLTDELANQLCPTDSRFRPDQRAMELGQFDLANQLKAQLEEKQRSYSNTQINKSDSNGNPLWFQKDENGQWRFTGKYWLCRANKQWDQCPKIFL